MNPRSGQSLSIINNGIDYWNNAMSAANLDGGIMIVSGTTPANVTITAGFDDNYTSACAERTAMYGTIDPDNGPWVGTDITECDQSAETSYFSPSSTNGGDGGGPDSYCPGPPGSCTSPIVINLASGRFQLSDVRVDPVWFDDGMSQADELRSLDDAGIVALGLDAHWTGRRDRSGNTFRYQAQYIQGRTTKTYYDIYFVTR